MCIMEEKIIKVLPVFITIQKWCESGGSNPLLISLAAEHVMNPQKKSHYPPTRQDTAWVLQQARKQTLTTHPESYHLTD
jgi:hypothetical protein